MKKTAFQSILFLIIWIFCCFQSGRAQIPTYDLRFGHFYTGEFIVLENGDIIYPFTSGLSSGNTTLARIDQNGNILWSKKIAGSAVQLAPGPGLSFYLTGNLDSLGNDRAFLSRIDSNGTPLWQRNLAMGVEMGEFRIKDRNKNTVVLALISKYSAPVKDEYLLEIDSSGAMIWDKMTNSDSTGNTSSIAIEPAGNGATFVMRNLYTSSTFCKYDSTGAILWSKQCEMNCPTTHLVSVGDSLLYAGGSCNYMMTEGFMYEFTFDGTFRQAWVSTVKTAMVALPDGRLACTFHDHDFGSGMYSYDWYGIFDPNTGMIGPHVYPTVFDDNGSGIQPHPQGGFVLTIRSGSKDTTVIRKTDANLGNMCKADSFNAYPATPWTNYSESAFSPVILPSPPSAMVTPLQLVPEPVSASLRCPQNVVVSAEPEQKDQVRIYPNPATDLVTIEAGFEGQMKRLRVFDNFGRMIMEKVSNQKRTVVEISGLASGRYHVRVESEEGMKMLPLIKH